MALTLVEKRTWQTGAVMPIKLKQREAFDRGCKRIARRLLRDCKDMLGPAFSKKPKKHTHDTRTHLKRLRALIRLVQPLLGEEIYRRENRCYKRAARKLAGARDAAVMLATFDAAASKLTTVASESLAALRQPLAKAAAPASEPSENKRKKVRDELRAARRRVADWPLTGKGFELVQPGLRATYCACRRSLRAAERSRSSEAIHELRKHAKYLLYQLQFLQGKTGALAERVNQLSDLGHHLGDHHDLAVLYALLDSQSHGDAEIAAGQQMRVYLQQQMAELETAALPLARQCLKLPPAQFIRAAASV